MGTPRTAEENALIAGILANRAEDTGYLVYADYLTERGDYIRVCVERSRLPLESLERADFDARADALVAAHGGEWFAPLGELGLWPHPPRPFKPWLWLSHTRGVIDQVVVVTPEFFPTNATRLFAAVPFLRKLRIEDGDFNVRSLANVKQLAQIEELHLYYCGTTDDELRAILRSKHFRAHTFSLFGSTFGDEGVRHLCAWPHLARLEELDVSRCDITAAGFERLGGCERLAGLKRLSAGHNYTVGADALLGSPHLAALEELALCDSNIDTTIAVGFGAFPKLRSLDLSSVGFQDTGFAALMAHPFPALEVLKLDSTRLTPGNMEALAHAPFAARLRELHLEQVDTGFAGLAALVSGTFPKLETLVLSRNRFGGRGAAILGLSAKRFPALAHLNLWDCNITPDGVADLVRSKLTAHLTALELHNNNIGPVGAEALAKSRHLKRLKKLIVDERSVGKKGRAALVARFGESVMDFR